MRRASSIWGALALCAILIVGGMLWLTSHVLSMERERVQAAAEAELQGRIRLGLSRLDSVASGVLLIENQRPPYHFRAFYKPEDVFSDSFENLDQGSVVRPSPLATELPEFVKLHFEISPEGKITSPQVPTVDDQQWGKAIAPPMDFLQRVESNMDSLRRILAAPQKVGAVEDDTNKNLDRLRVQEDAFANAPAGEKQKRSKWLANRRLENRGNEIALNQSDYQDELTRQEKGSRAAVYQEVLKKAVKESGKTESNPYVQIRSNIASKKGNVPLGASITEESVSPIASEEVLAVEEPIEISAFNALWVSGQLFAVRSIESAGKKRFQGVWFDASALRDHLVESVREGQLLPLASLSPITGEEESSALNSLSRGRVPVAEGDPLALVTMPWRLIPGEKVAVASLRWSQLQLSLGIVWIAALFGLLAAAALMRGVMKLSERRASFVSSVTHELRTPLTTFQLYSDMLAEGMITDETKKKEYLQTLRKEAGRLNHLIENVLAYSRIERGGAKTRNEEVNLKSLLDRLVPRLEQRAQDAQASFQVEVPPEDESAVLFTDAAAVEQIIFNLLDNACKYGLAETGEKIIVLEAKRSGGKAMLQICDNGRGISRRDRAMLFRPFQKSSRDEADTKPGVGLGLSLCRRLARALGGDLTDVPQSSEGACFRLTLPLKS